MGIKEFFSKLRELWRIPKFKGIVQLVFWFIFFLVIALIFRSADNNIPDVKVDTSVNSYEYNYQYKEDNNIIDISGTYYKDKQVFYMNNIKYYYLNNNYYLATTSNITEIPYAINEWGYESIKNIIDNNSYSNKIEYEDNVRYEYNVVSSVYNSYYNTNYTNDITITVIKDEFIESASINYGFGIVDIKYSNINKIKNLDISID